MEVFYLKIDKDILSTYQYLRQWCDIIREIDDSLIYLVCDDLKVRWHIENNFNFKEVRHCFINSQRDSAELQYIIEVLSPGWKKMSYAHFTPFLHAQQMGYKNYWNIDGDDIGLYAEPKRIAQVLMVAKQYAQQHDIQLFALDTMTTLYCGKHWTFGVVYTDNSLNWIDMIVKHSHDELLSEKYFHVAGGKPQINADWLMTYLRAINAAKIETFCFFSVNC